MKRRNIMTFKPEDVVLSAVQGWDQAITPAILDAALAWYADDAVVTLIGLPPDQPNTFRGKAQIRAWLEELAAHDFNLKLEACQVSDDTVTTLTRTWMDWSRKAGIAPIIATEVYVIHDGNIVSETWTISTESQARIAAISGT
jgi:ketosteroid isomerase-like protein